MKIGQRFIGLGGRLARRVLRRMAATGRQHSSHAAIDALEPRLQLSGSAPLAPNASISAQALLPDLLPWASKSRGYIYGWRLDRSQIPGKTLLRLSTAMANIGAGPVELRGGPAVHDGQRVFQRLYNSDGTHTDRVAGTFTYHPEHHHIHFDDFAEYRLRGVNSSGEPGRILRTGNKVSFCLTDSDEYDLSRPGAVEDGKYFSCSGKKQGISVGWSDVYGDSLADQWIDVTGIRPGKYFLEVVVDPANRLLESNENNNTTHQLITIRPMVKPKNDDFGSRTRLGGKNVSVKGSNQFATDESREPTHETAGGASIWYTWTAPSSGSYTITTAGSNIDTLLSVYTGKNLGKLTRVAGNDDDQSIRTSRVTIKVTKGTAYQIAVDGYRGATGTIRLAIRAGSTKK